MTLTDTDQQDVALFIGDTLRIHDETCEHHIDLGPVEALALGRYLGDHTDLLEAAANRARYARVLQVATSLFRSPGAPQPTRLYVHIDDYDSGDGVYGVDLGGDQLEQLAEATGLTVEVVPCPRYGLRDEYERAQFVYNGVTFYHDRPKATGGES